MRKKILTIALLLVLPFFVTACTLQDLPVIGKLISKVPSPATGSGTVNVWGLWENPEVLDVAIAKYKEANKNVNVNYDDRSVIKPDQYKDTVVTRLNQNDVPDVVVIHSSWVPALKSYLSPMPSGLMSTQDYTSKYYPVASKNAVLDNKIYAVPVYYDGLMLVYNKKHFAEVEQINPPTGWEELRKLALSLTKRDEKGNLVRAGAAIGAADNIDFFSDILGLLFAQAGVQYPNELDSTKAVDALTYYTLLYNDGMWNNSMPEASVAFAQEKVSMIFIPSWNLLDIIKSRPDLDIGVAPVPQALPENPVSWGSFWMFAVPEKSTNKEAAWNFIKYLASDEAQLTMYSKASTYRTYGAPFASVSLAGQIKGSANAKYLAPLLDTAPFSVTDELAARSGNMVQVTALKEAVDSLIFLSPDKRPLPIEALKIVKQKIMNPTKK
jgi:multiple sugar transport system substrate-binding protein